MRRFILFITVISFCFISFSQNKIEINEWLIAGHVKAFKPAFADVKNIDGKIFTKADLLKEFRLDFNQVLPSQGMDISIGNQKLTWEELSAQEDSIIIKDIDSNSILLLATYISTDRWTNAKISISSDALFELYIDNKLEKTRCSTYPLPPEFLLK